MFKKLNKLFIFIIIILFLYISLKIIGDPLKIQKLKSIFRWICPYIIKTEWVLYKKFFFKNKYLILTFILAIIILIYFFFKNYLK